MGVRHRHSTEGGAAEQPLKYEYKIILISCLRFGKYELSVLCVPVAVKAVDDNNP